MRKAMNGSEHLLHTNMYNYSLINMFMKHANL